MLEYEPEKFPQGLMLGPKMVINLRPPSNDHWNIATDLVLPLAVDTFRRRREGKWMAQGLEGESVGAKVSPMEAPAPGGSPQVVAGSGRAAPPTENTNQGEDALETAREILECVHTIRLQTMHEMGSMRKLDRTVARTLIAEFVRLQIIIGEDLTESLVALRTDLETSCEALSSDFVRTLNLHSDDPVFLQVKELIEKFQQSISMKVNLPLMELGAAREDLEGFLQRCLCEISSQSESQKIIEELSWTLSVHTSRVQEVIQAPGLNKLAVFRRVMVGLAMDQPLEANFFPGILDRLTGRLGSV